MAVQIINPLIKNLEDKHKRWLVSCRENGLDVNQTHELLLSLLENGTAEARDNARTMLTLTTIATRDEFNKL